MQFGLGFLLAVAISTAAFAARGLSRSGAVAAVTLGTIVYGFGGWQAASMLLAFFLSSTLLGGLLRKRQGSTTGYEKSGRRDAGQVAGNGIAAAIFAAMGYLAPGELWPWICLAGSLAAVNADTWATELGGLSPSSPRLITRLHQVVPAGTSGGVTVTGSLAGLAGALFIAILAAILVPAGRENVLVAACAGGVAGALLDSVLGATIQAMYECPVEHLATEQHPLHYCGAATVFRRGWMWLNNDLVNFACSVAGAATALLAARMAAVP